jgi:hypothetical protein
VHRQPQLTSHTLPQVMTQVQPQLTMHGRPQGDAQPGIGQNPRRKRRRGKGPGAGGGAPGPGKQKWEGLPKDEEEVT